MLDIGIVIPQLTKYGGAERLLIECLARWQYKHKLTVYSTAFNPAVINEHGIGKSVSFRCLSPQIENNAHSFLLNASFTPKLWSAEIGRHDVYNTHLWPTHLTDVSPAVWYPHEPLRLLHDLRNNKDAVGFTSEEERRVHIYPKYTYDTVHAGYFQPMLSAAGAFDGTGAPYRIVANSHYCAKYIETVYKRPVSRVVYPGVTVDDFLPPMASEYLLTVAQLWPHKRVHLAIQSLRLLEDMQLYIVGSGPEKEALVTQAKELGVYDRTFFLSGLTNHELQIVFSRALAVIFMPVREPFGIVALEAMAASKPLIAVNEGGYVEVVDEKSACLIPPHVTALAEKVAELRNNPEKARAMGRHGHELAKRYTWDRTAAELLEEIEDARAAWNAEHAVTLTSERPGTLFGAHYYGWYGDGLGSAHWNDNLESGAVKVMPALGYYASGKPDVAEHHLRMAADMGLDFLSYNLHLDGFGADRNALASLSILLDQAQRIHSSVKVNVQLCLYGCPEKYLERLFRVLRASVFSHPCYLHWNGQPVLGIFWTGQHDGDMPYLNVLRRETNPALLIASSLRMYDRHTEDNLTFQVFDGWSLFSPLELSSQNNWEKLWSKAYENSAAGSKNIRCVTVSPGYDDTALTSVNRQGNLYRRIPREAGSTYRRMWAFALSVSEPPDFVFISTFNEFHENTHIEPTAEEGFLYGNITRECVNKGRALWNS